MALARLRLGDGGRDAIELGEHDAHRRAVAPRRPSEGRQVSVAASVLRLDLRLGVRVDEGDVDPLASPAP